MVDQVCSSGNRINFYKRQKPTKQKQKQQKGNRRNCCRKSSKRVLIGTDPGFLSYSSKLERRTNIKNKNES